MPVEKEMADGYPTEDAVNSKTGKSFTSDQVRNEEGRWNMTNGDCIRSMSDEELADLFTNLLSARDHDLLQKLRNAGIAAHLCEMPVVSRTRHLVWLRSEVEM